MNRAAGIPTSTAVGGNCTRVCLQAALAAQGSCCHDQLRLLLGCCLLQVMVLEERLDLLLLHLLLLLLQVVLPVVGHVTVDQQVAQGTPSLVC
jgi:hypothetical protein